MKTRAALFHAVGEPLEVVELDLDEPRPNEVVVRMAAVGICGTDLHQVKGEFQRPTPMVLGHEGAGIVEEVGDAVTLVQPGDDVVLSWAPSCGDVRRMPSRSSRDLRAAQRGDRPTVRCPTGRPGCRTEARRSIAAPRPAASPTGSSSPSRSRCRFGGAVPFDQAALLGCAALTGVGAVALRGAGRRPARRCS